MNDWAGFVRGGAGRVGAFLRGKRDRLVYFAGGVVVSVGVAASADYMATSSSGAPCGDLSQAVQGALSNKMELMARTDMDPSKYFASGSDSSCLPDLATANIDLSMMIPDPMGMLAGLANGALDKLTSAAQKAVCTAARNSFGNIISNYNSAITAMNNGGQLLNQQLGALSSQTLNNAAMNWTSGTQTSILSGVTIPQSGTASAGAASLGGVVQSVLPGATSATTYTSAAGAVESARLALSQAQSNLQSVQGSVSNMVFGDSSGQVAAAQAAVAAAQSTYNQAVSGMQAAQSAVTGAVTGTAPAAGSGN